MPIIDESIIIRHSIEDRFRPLSRVTVKDHYRMFIAIEEQIGMTVVIKEVTGDRVDGLSQELSVYREMEERGVDAAISKLYQLFTHGEIYVLVK